MYHNNYDWDFYGYPGEFVYGDERHIPDDYLDERWKRIDPMGKYWVSDRARVWSSATQQFLKVKPLDRHGHLGVCLSYGDHTEYRYIHRLVAQAFMPNPNKLPVVRHLNDRPYDNEIENLAWGTQRDNAYDSIRNGNAYILTDEDREKGFRKTRTPIIATCLQTGEEMYFEGQGDAERTLGIHQANIYKVLNGKRSHAKGYSFRYVRRGGNQND